MFKIVFMVSLVLMVSVSASALDSLGQSKPLWQLGLGAGAVKLPYYLGARDTDTRGFPTVLPVYRGQVFTSDEEGIRGKLYEESRWKIDVSGDFNFSVDSEDIEARSGMPDLPFVLQVGPSLQYQIADSDRRQFYLDLPMRFAVSGDDNSVGYEGLVVHPKLVYRHYWGKLDTPWKLTHSVGPIFGSEKLNRFYYDVDAQFATAGRTSFEARGGYNGYRVQTGVSKFTEKYFFVMFARYENSQSAINKNSPLMAGVSNLGVGLLFGYFLFNSEERVNR